MITQEKLNEIAEEVQDLLFDVSPRVEINNDLPIDDGFYQNGYVIVKDIHSLDKANSYLHSFVGALNTEQLPLFKGMLKRMKLAKLDLLPVCDDIVQTGFQALHYDMGQPFASDQPQTMYTITGLYRSPESQPNDKGKTRIVNIEKLLSQKSFGDFEKIEKTFTEYIEKYGDGWLTPSPHNTKRLAIFARVLDAMSGNTKLSGKIDTMIGQCFNYDKTKEGVAGLEQEQKFFTDLGLNLKDVEKQIVLAPGEMLIFDNLRCVHGRVGLRHKKELYNFLYGVEQATDEEISRYKTWLIKQFT